MVAFVATLKIAARVVACVAVMGLAATGVSAQQATPKFPEIELPSDFMAGYWAIEALGAKLPALAAWYGMTPEELKRELHRYHDRDEHHHTEWYVRRNGPIMIRESFHYPETYSLNRFPLQPLAPIESTLRLSSDPLAQVNITLSFSPRSGQDNQSVQAYSATEKIAIQHIWAQVAQDFAPFNVNVTTDFMRYGWGDMLVSVSRHNTNLNVDSDKIRSDVDFKTFTDRNSSEETIGFVPVHVNYLERNPKVVAHTISHMIGHILGLRDETDRQPSSPYFIPMPPHAPEDDHIYYKYMPYAGHQTPAGRWSPIMGYPSDADVRQFSRGEYPGAVNQSDSFAIMQRNGLPLRTDDHGGTWPTASALTITPGTPAVISGVLERANDRDLFAIQAAPGLLQAGLTPSFGSANANYALRLFDNRGVQIAIANPRNSLVGSFRYIIRAPGTYYLLVTPEAVAADANGPGIPAYGNRGAYTLTANYTPATQTLPTASFIASSPQGLVAGSSIQFNATAADRVGIAGYSWDFGDGTQTRPSAGNITNKTFARPGTYRVSLRVQNTQGFSTSVQNTIVITALSPPAASAPAASFTTSTLP